MHPETYRPGVTLTAEAARKAPRLVTLAEFPDRASAEAWRDTNAPAAAVIGHDKRPGRRVVSVAWSRT